MTKLFSFIYTIPLSLLLCATTCTDGCGGENPSKQYNVENNTLIEIENNANTFNLGETIYIGTSIADEQITTDNLQINISDFHNYNSLDYTLGLYKEFNFGSPTKIPVNQNNIEIIYGDLIADNNINNPHLLVKNTLENGSFSSKFGIKLLETGTYYLGSNYADNNNGTITIYSGNQEGDLILKTTIVNANTDNFYQFTVN